MKLAIEESVLRQALEALDSLYNKGMWAIEHVSAANYASREREAYKDFTKTYDKSLTALRSALDAAEKVEPVAWIHRHKAYPTKVDDLAPGYYGSAWSHEPLYIHPQDAELLKQQSISSQLVDEKQVLIAELSESLARLEGVAECRLDRINGLEHRIKEDAKYIKTMVEHTAELEEFRAAAQAVVDWYFSKEVELFDRLRKALG